MVTSQTDYSEGMSDARNKMEARLGEPNQDSSKPVFAEDATDLTIIREMLAKTPEERLRALEMTIRTRVASR